MTSTISRPTESPTTPWTVSSGGTKDTQQAAASTSSIPGTPAGAQLTEGQTSLAAQCTPALGVQSAARHLVSDAQDTPAVGSNSAPGPEALAASTPNQLALLDPALALAADVLDDLERVRTANSNRLRQLTRSVEDCDGEMRGFGLDESHPDVARLAAMVATLEKVEHEATLQLQRQVRRHPLYSWVQAQRGVGEKQAGRLLAAIGDPYINSATGLPRTVSALWAYCGLHVVPAGQSSGDDQLDAAGGDGGDPGHVLRDAQHNGAGVAPKRRRGQRANWSTNAKIRAYLIAESCSKQLVKPCTSGDVDGRWTPAHSEDCACSEYRVVYDSRRAHTAVTHPDWTAGHSHADALRVASKAILRDLWRAAREVRSAA